ncbi:gliding motility-associated C-terminal domain-containing protein [Sporocytophaga sp.]|uniref:T9SS type B sorting domain-containing protein n=1 Tax=Sporocytophaga sp. TaxID=2231183 RepID=UPI0025DED41C|nr:gliding motility-associated C-terminal domain-containing protein [Sporocytophaga sp.]
MSILFSSGLKAQDLLVSGGNTVSTIICSNGFVFTWGNNKAGPTGGEVLGILGGGTTNAIESSPVKVIFPTNDPYFNSINSGITVKAVDAGSGAHFIAVDCYGGAWSWGNNGGAMGITGTGSNAAATTVPGRVKRGEAPASPNALLSQYLVDVKYVSGGNDNSYVILNNGTALGWGRNDKGQLANGNFTNSATPVYIRTPDGNPLTNVIQIEAGDETAYALVDPDGDGLGTVYSWGAGTGTYGGTGMLGRNAAGTANNGAEVANDNYARPVLKKDGTPLDGVVSISAADVMCLAMDATGYVWAWGNDGWGSMTGQGATVGNFSDPRRVVAGEWGTTAGAGLGETFLKAKAISGGQGYGMAVTIDGKPVAWGNNGACGTSGSGGHLGNGTTAQSAFPVFIRRNATTVDNNVVSISDGDTWGFYTTSNNLIYTWGNNAMGQLGIGSTTCASYATQFTLPPCAFPAPKPKATISPRDFSVCLSKWSGTTLNSGFVISASLESSYKITWYKNGVQVATGDGSAVTYKAISEGTYQVKVEYVGTDVPCSKYVPAIDEITISTYPQDFTVPNGLTFCGSTVYLKTATGNGLYDWYTAATGGTKLGTSYRQDSVGVAKSAITEKVGTDYFAYVEQKGYASGNTGEIKPATCGSGNQNSMNPPSNSNTMIRVYSESVTIDTVTVYQNSEYQGSTKNYTWQVCVYGTKLTNGKPIADRSNVIACGTVVTRPGVDQPGIGQLKLPVGITLPGSATGTDYWLGFSATTTGTGIYFKCNPNWPVLDDVPGGEFLNMINVDNYGNPANAPEWGLFANIKFHSEQRYCDRLKVKLTENCPCSQPKTVIVNKGFDNDTTICAGSNLIITGEYMLDATKPVQNKHRYSWYKKVGTVVTVITAPTVVTTSPVTLTLSNVTAADEGIYFFKVEDSDGITSISSCYLQDSLKLTVDVPLPVGGIGTNQIICSGSKPDDLQNINTLTPGTKFQWRVTPANLSGATNFKNIVGANTKDYTFPGAADTAFYNTGTTNKVYSYHRRDSSGVCPTVISNVVTITVLPELKPGTISASQVICKGTAPAPLTQTPATGGSLTYGYQWLSSQDPEGVFDVVTVGTGPTNALYVPPVLSDSIYYTRKVTSTAGGAICTAYSDTIKIAMVPDIAEVKIKSDQTICYNTPAANITISTPLTGGLKSGDSYSYRWESLADASGSTWTGPIGTTAGYAPGTLTDTMQYRLVVTGSCGAASRTSNVVKVTVLPDLKGGTIVGGGTVCSGEDPADITNQTLPFGANGLADYTYDWDVTPAIPGTLGYSVPVFPANNGSVAVTYSIKRIVKSNQCLTSAESNVVTYTVNPTVKPGTIGDDQQLCSGNTINALTQKTPPTGGDGTTYTYQWQYSLTGTPGSFADVTPAATGSSFTPVPQASTIYFARLDNSPGCQAVLSIPVKITILPGILAGSIGSDQDICSGSYADTIKTKTLPSNVSAAATSVWKISTTSASGPWSNAPAQLVPSDVFYKYPASLTAGTIWIIKDVKDPNGPPLCNTAQTAPVKIVTRAPLTGGQIGSNQTICADGDPAAFTELVAPTGGKDDVAYKYSWQYSTNGTSWNTISNTNSPVYDPGALNITTRYKRVVNDVLGCGPVNSNEVVVTVNPNLTPKVTINDPGQTCTGALMTFNVSTKENEGLNPTYEWTVNGTVQGTGTSFSSSTLANGAVVAVKLTSSEQCITPLTNPAISNAVTVQIMTNITPSITLADPGKICVGTPTTFIPSSNGGGATPSYQWYKNGQPDGTSSTYSGIFNDGDQINVVMTSVLSCVVPGSNPATSNTISMQVLSIPQPNIVESDAIFCSGDDTTFTSAVGTGTTLMWYKDGLPLNITTPSLTVSQPGMYYLNEDNGVCPRFSDTVTVVVIPTPIANAGSDIYVLENTVVTLNGSGGDLYSWSPATGLNFTDIPNPTFTATDNTIYVLTVADATNTCSSTDEVEIFVERPVKIPNAFTPNKDGNNDTWEIENINGFPNVTFEVYNRWGTLVWKWTGNLKQWDGTNYRNGEVLPDGTYFYVIDLHSVIFNEPYSGYVQILK